MVPQALGLIGPASKLGTDPNGYEAVNVRGTDDVGSLGVVFELRIVNFKAANSYLLIDHLQI